MLTTTLIRINHLYKILKRFYYTKILRRHYYRVGKCKCCGACCTHIYVKHGRKVVDSEEKFEALKGLHRFYTYLDVVGKDELGLIFSCRMKDPKTNLCKIHKMRPGICRRYPQEQIFMMGGTLTDDCGFKLVPIIPFSEVLEKVMKKS